MRPLPQPDDATAEFWAACKRHELVMQRCGECDAYRFPPRPMCPKCRSMACRWERVSGRGKIYSFVIAHPPVLPAFAERVPLPIVLVELAEDPSLRIVGNFEGEYPWIGAPVEVFFEDLTDDVSLPQWRESGARA